MKILATIIPLLLLLRGAKAQGQEARLDPKTCDFTQYDMCGDSCISSGYACRDCVSGSISLSNEHCCLEYEESCLYNQNAACSCTTDIYKDGDCRNKGRTMSHSTPCNTTMGPQCYNSYHHSLIIGRKAHYTCPDTCVPWEDMCQGISWCEGDNQACGPDLRCPSWYDSDNGNNIGHYITKLNFSSSLVPGHNFCIDIERKKMMENLIQLTDLTRHKSYLRSLR